MEMLLMPILGGLLIGLASSLMLGGLGRITGISGILASALTQPRLEHFWRYFFLIGLIAGGLLLKCIAPHFFDYKLEASWLRLILAGLLVGIGTRLGGGCTSGHGVCGLARLSKRSFFATMTFILFGMLTVWLERFFV